MSKVLTARQTARDQITRDGENILEGDDDISDRAVVLDSIREAISIVIGSADSPGSSYGAHDE